MTAKRFATTDHADEAGFMLLLDIFPGLIYRNIDPKALIAFSFFVSLTFTRSRC